MDLYNIYKNLSIDLDVILSSLMVHGLCFVVDFGLRSYLSEGNLSLS